MAPGNRITPGNMETPENRETLSLGSLGVGVPLNRRVGEVPGNRDAK